MKSLLRYNSLLCLCHLGSVLSLRSYTHIHTHSLRVNGMQERAYMCVGQVITYEMYTGVNLSCVNGFLNVRESRGMIKGRCVILCGHDQHGACCRARSTRQPRPMRMCARVCAAEGRLPPVLMSA